MANETEFDHSVQRNYYGCGPGWRGRDFGGDDGYITKYELDLVQKLIDEERKNAILRAENDTDKKLVDVYAKLETKINKVADELEQARRHQEDINREQAVYNGVNNAHVGQLRQQIAELTALYVPAWKVTPLPMERYNKWDIPIAKQPGADAAPAEAAK